MNEHPPTFDLDLFLAEEVEPTDTENIRQHLDQCAECRRYVEDRMAERANQMELLSPKVFAHQVEERFAAEELPVEPSRGTARPRRWVWSVGFAVLATAAAVLLALLLIPNNDGSVIADPDGPGPDDIRWMGDAPVVRLQIMRNEQLVDDSQPIAGDRLQYEVTMPPGEQGYAMVVAAEGDRVFSVLPENGHPVEISDVEWIPGSIAFEPGGVVHLYLFVRSEPFVPQTLVDEVREALVVGGGDVQPPSGLVHRMTVDLTP